MYNLPWFRLSVVFEKKRVAGVIHTSFAQTTDEITVGNTNVE